MICLQCGHPCKNTDKFCYHCGAGLESAAHDFPPEDYGEAAGYETGQHRGAEEKMKMPRLSYLLTLGISLTLANIAYTAVSVSLIVIYLTVGLASRQALFSPCRLLWQPQQKGSCSFLLPW
jgi:uncharacterized protein YfiM (DUF2279 family)